MMKMKLFCEPPRLASPLWLAVPVFVVVALAGLAHGAEERLPGTAPLTMEGDIAAQLVEGVDRFLLTKLDQSVSSRAARSVRDFKSHDDYSASLASDRERLRHILGVRDQRIVNVELDLLATTNRSATVGKGNGYTVSAVRWPVFEDVHGEGLLLVPDAKPLGYIVAIPDCEQAPEQLVGLAPGIAVESQFARKLAESGCVVLVPTLINRQTRIREIPNREYLYRSAFELGRHLVGYELQKILAGIDWFAAEATRTNRPAAKFGVVGWGEGGLLALYAGALDPRIGVIGVSGHFGPREGMWREPIDRNVFGLLERFGDAELAAMIAPRSLIIEASAAPNVALPGKGGAPATITTPSLDHVRAEFTRATKLVEKLAPGIKLALVESGGGTGPYGTDSWIAACLDELRAGTEFRDSGTSAKVTGVLPDAVDRHRRQMDELDRFTQRLLVLSPYVRQGFMKDLKYDSVEQYQQSVEPYREYFRQSVIGHFDDAPLPFNARSRVFRENEKWTAHEVVLDVFPDVMAYGLLLVPKDVRAGEKRPVVVCQHGLEGRPQHVIGEEGFDAYKAFAARLAEQGFVTFAPQNLYIFQDKFRTLQRKANPLGKTLFSVIVPQHQQIVDWLKTQPFVDPTRIAFYGLSYGGKSAMRIPPLVPDYCLSICSADFNEWVDKNASTTNPHSYVNMGEYEIFEFDLGSTFNYAEMAALIAPRPFMVERGHFDGVASDETVGYEFAKVRNLYAARLKIPDKCEIEWFDGPHTINGQGTFRFLHHHLRWNAPTTGAKP